MTVPADRWCGRIVELAARVLPAEQRQRYAREFIAELHGMSRSQQYRHSAQVLAHAWALRAVLHAAGPTTTQEGIMSKPLLCRLFIHRWVTLYNDEGQRYQECARCHSNRDKITLTNQALMD